LDALYDHFDRSGDSLGPEQIMEMTALDANATTNALRVLHKMARSRASRWPRPTTPS
jgi:hypothetical protein